MEFMFKHHRLPGQPARQYATESTRKKNAMEKALLEAVQLDLPDATAKDVKMPEVLESWLYMARSGMGPAEHASITGRAGGGRNMKKLTAAFNEMWPSDNLKAYDKKNFHKMEMKFLPPSRSPLVGKPRQHQKYQRRSEQFCSCDHHTVQIFVKKF